MLRVVPKSSQRNMLVRSSQASKRHNMGLEFLDPKGYRIVASTLKSTGKMTLAADASRQALHNEISHFGKTLKLSLPVWSADEVARTET